MNKRVSPSSPIGISSQLRLAEDMSKLSQDIEFIFHLEGMQTCY